VSRPETAKRVERRDLSRCAGHGILPGMNATASRRFTLTPVPLLLLLLLSSCRSTAITPPEGSVTHVVVCWLKTPGDETSQQALIDTSYSFREIPGVLHVSAGRALPSTRPVVDATFDVAIVMTFESERALRAYDEHPIHRDAVTRTLRPLVERLVIYDFRND
jgi:hypothetical protein